MCYFGFRLAVVLSSYVCSFIIPNIHSLLVIGGSVLGSLVTIVMPVMFYNRAYSDKEKNLLKEKSARPETPAQTGTTSNLHLQLQNSYDDHPFNEQDPLVLREDDIILENKDQMQIQKDESEAQLTDGQVRDRRRRMRIFNYFVMLAGCTVGFIGLVDGIRELAKNGAQRGQ